MSLSSKVTFWQLFVAWLIGKEQRREEGQKEGFTLALLSLRYHDFPGGRTSRAAGFTFALEQME